jgi:hypothetical protein
MEPSGRNWEQPVANATVSKNGSNGLKLLPWVATGCRDPKMVRRGSTVRARQRALQKSRKAGLSLSIGLHIQQRALGMELIMEPSDLDLKLLRFGAVVALASAEAHLREFESTAHLPVSCA